VGRIALSLLLDTHAALWLVQGDARLGDAARARIERASPGDLFISDLLLLELAMLLKKGRVIVKTRPADFLDRLARRFEVVPLTSIIAVRAMGLPLPQGDPFDRVFVATAIEIRAELVSRDAAIRESSLVPVVW
jgi:PIN domain nuclease of toxin-antitoxin system